MSLQHTAPVEADESAGKLFYIPATSDALTWGEKKLSLIQAKCLESSNVSGKGMMAVGMRGQFQPLCLLFYGF